MPPVHFPSPLIPLSVADPDSPRVRLGLTQREFAAWLGTTRAVVALAETNRQSWPLGSAVAEGRLEFALRGELFEVATGAVPGPPPLPLPTPYPAPIDARIREVRYRLGRLTLALGRLRAAAARYEARYRVVPILRAYTTPLHDAEREDRWITNRLLDAQDALLRTCGAGPQRLLAARIAGLQAELAVLTAPDEAAGG